MSESENMPIYEFSTKLDLGGSNLSDWYSTGYAGSWTSVYPENTNITAIPEPINQAFRDELINVSKISPGRAVPCVMGRIIVTESNKWSVLAFVIYGKDNKAGRNVPAYRVFFCEGDNIEYILYRVYSYKKEHRRLPYFDPFYEHGYLYESKDLSNEVKKKLDCQLPSIDAYKVINENSTNKVVFINKEQLSPKKEITSLLMINRLAKQRCKAIKRLDSVAWAYNADLVLENASSFAIISPYDQKVYDEFESSKDANEKIKEEFQVPTINDLPKTPLDDINSQSTVEKTIGEQPLLMSTKGRSSTLERLRKQKNQQV